MSAFPPTQATPRAPVDPSATFVDAPQPVGAHDGAGIHGMPAEGEAQSPGELETAGEPSGPGGPPGPPGSPGPTRRRRRGRWIAEWAAILVIALVVAFVVRTYVAETFYVPSTSMWPTLKGGDRIIVDKLFGTIHVGDIIVFKRPPAEDCGGPPVPDLVKRVIGLPGQTVSARGGQVYITGKLLKEPWLPKGPQAHTTMSKPAHVPAGDYYVMGDNRIDSCDSRIWGPVEKSWIVGKVFLIMWPPSRFRYF